MATSVLTPIVVAVADTHILAAVSLDVLQNELGTSGALLAVALLALCLLADDLAPVQVT